MTPTDDTIVAVSSPPGRSPRGLVRLAGPNAISICDQLVDLKKQGKQCDKPRVLCGATLRLPATANAGGTTRTFGLPVLVACFNAPSTYTGQDMVELQCPGNPALLERVLQHACTCGARLAEPGEFTFRAYTAGKLDLTQAEGVAATIAAVSDSQLRAAKLLREGELGRFADDLVDTLATQLALVEAGIDFTDQEDVVPIGPGALLDGVVQMISRLDEVNARSRSWGELEALPRVVLVGPPSTGKSTLFNALLGRHRAVVSASPGTTRDVLTEPLKLHDAADRPVEVLLTDIAGLDDPTSALDRDAQRAADDAVRRADLIVAVDDGQPHASDRLTNDTAESLHIRAKSDLPDAAGSPESDLDMRVSALTGEGLDDLRRAIAERVSQRGVSLSGDMLALQPRHESALQAASQYLAEARDLLAPQRDAPAIAHVELVAGAMRAALDELAGLGGEVTPDDVIGRVFATFCVGK